MSKIAATLSNVENREDGLYEKSTGKKIESPLETCHEYQIPFVAGETSCFSCRYFVSNERFCQTFNNTTTKDKNCKFHQHNPEG